MVYTRPDSNRRHTLVSGWRPAVVVGLVMALAMTVTPWQVLRAAGLSMPGSMLVAAHLLLGFSIIVLALRSDLHAPGISALTVVLLTLAAAAFAAVSDTSQAQAFSLEWADVRALATARVLVGGAAVLATLTCVVGAILHKGDQRKLEVALAGQCLLVGASAAMWQPLADLTHPMLPTLAAVPL